MTTAFAAFLVLALIGLGPAAACLGRQERPPATAWIALAPAVGLAIVTVVAFPLYRYVAPVEVWMLPGLAALLLLSSALCVLHRRVVLAALTTPDAGLVLICSVVVGAALGIEQLSDTPLRSLHGYNPSDALVYLTIADSVLRAGWDTLFTVGWNFPRGREILTLTDLPPSPEATLLLQQSATALYSARMVAIIPIRTATMIDMAWLRGISSLGWHELLFAFKIAVLLCSVAAAGGLARLLGAPLWVAATVAAAAALNHWTIMTMEHDGYSQLQVMPLMVLAVAVWSWLVLGAARGRALLHALGGIAIVGVLVAYTEFAPAFVLTLAAGGVVATLLGHPLRLVAGATAGLLATAATIAVLTGQASHHITGLLTQMRFVQGATTGPVGSTLLDNDLLVSRLHAALGSWWLSPWLPSYAWTTAIGLGALLALGLQVLRWRPHPALVAAAALLFGTMVVAAYALLQRGDNYVALKLYATAFPFAVVLAGHGLAQLRARQVTSWVSGLAGLLVLASQLGYAARFHTLEATGATPSYITRSRDGGHPLPAVVATLAELRPRGLILDDPPDAGTWWHSAFLMLALADQPAFHRSGLLFDNNANRLRYADFPTPVTLDYALVAAKHDTLQGEPYATMLRDFGSLRLYRITEANSALLRFRTQP